MRETLLWVNGKRDPNGPASTEMFFPTDRTNTEVIWIQSFQEFKNWILDNGLPIGVSFDYDLGDRRVVLKKGNQDKEERIFRAETGLTCINWLINYCIDNKSDLPLYSVHAANPIAKSILRKTLISFSKFKKKDKEFNAVLVKVLNEKGKVTHLN